MDQLGRALSRRRLLRRGGAGALGLYAAVAAGALGLAGRSARAADVTLNGLTWSDHFFPEQLQEVEKATGIAGRPQLFSDDLDAYIKVKAGGGAWDMASEDALWVPKFYEEGLIEAFDIKSFAVAKQLYSVALDIPFWKSGSSQMGYPFGWSSIQIYYNPKYVTTKPTSWQALLDKKYAKRIVIENAPTDDLAMAGLATGAKKPYDMTADEISLAKDFLVKLRPNVLKLVSQNTETVRALADEFGVDRARQPRHRRAREGCWRSAGRGGDPGGGRGRLDGRGDAPEGVREQGRLPDLHQHDGGCFVDRQELPGLRAPAVQ